MTTTITFIGKSGVSEVNWDDPTVWQGGVPNDPTVDVVIPTILSGGNTFHSDVTIAASESFSANSVSLTNNTILLDGSLSVTNDFSITTLGEVDLKGGSLSAASLEISGASNQGGDVQGTGQVTVTGMITVDAGASFGGGDINGGSLIVTAAGLSNAGTLAGASGDLTVNITSGGFTNLSGSTLTGGTYLGGFQGSLHLNVGGVIGVDAANIELEQGGAIYSYDSVSGMYKSLQSTLQTIAASGILSLSDQTYNSVAALDDKGQLILIDNTTFSAPQLTVDSHGGVAIGGGVIDAPIVNNGVVEAAIEFDSPATVLPPSTTLKIVGSVTGSGELVIGIREFWISHGIFLAPTLELDGAVSQNVVFSDQYGTLVLDDPSHFTGTISGLLIGDSIQLTSIQAVGVRVSGSTLYVTEANSQVLSFALPGSLHDIGFAIESAGPSGSDLQVVSKNENDINGDGFDDVLIQNAGNGDISYANMAGGVFSGWVDVAVTPGWNVIGTGDVNGDGFADIVIQNGSGGQIQYANMHGGAFSGWGVIGGMAGFNAVGVGDVNGDGYADVVVQSTAGQTEYANMAGGVFKGWVSVATTPNAKVVGVGDINGDGYADIVLQGSGGQIAYANMAGGAFSGWVNVGNTPGWSVVGVGDIKGNGYDDIVVQDAAGDTSYADMTGGVFSGWVAVADTPGWKVAAVEDVNGDGFADVVIEDGTGQIEYANMANGVFNGFGVVGNAPGYNVFGNGEAAGAAAGAVAAGIDPAPPVGATPAAADPLTVAAALLAPDPATAAAASLTVGAPNPASATLAPPSDPLTGILHIGATA